MHRVCVQDAGVVDGEAMMLGGTVGEQQSGGPPTGNGTDHHGERVRHLYPSGTPRRAPRARAATALRSWSVVASRAMASSRSGAPAERKAYTSSSRKQLPATCAALLTASCSSASSIPSVRACSSERRKKRLEPVTAQELTDAKRLSGCTRESRRSAAINSGCLPAADAPAACRGWCGGFSRAASVTPGVPVPASRAR